MNHFLKNKYNLIILDRYHIHFKIINISYGLDEYRIDLTDKLMSECYSHNKLYISNKINLNMLSGDPYPNKPKYVYIKYYINDYIFEEKYQELCGYLVDDITFNMENSHFINKFGWINSINRDMFDDILKNISFNAYFTELSNPFVNQLKLNDKINVIHLRLEDDAITHWSKQNNMIKDLYKNELENKYIDIIINHVDKNDLNIILSYSNNNKVINYLSINNYKYTFIPKKLYLGREMNALIDLLISKNCNNLFIGNFNMNGLNGSSFSYLIAKKLNGNIKCIFIDIDHIKDNIVIHHL